jgi:hypothetical protein
MLLERSNFRLTVDAFQRLRISSLVPFAVYCAMYVKRELRKRAADSLLFVKRMCNTSQVVKIARVSCATMHANTASVSRL